MLELTLALGVGVACASLVWLGMQRGRHWLERYRQHFNDSTRSGLQEFFLFLDPAQLWMLNVVMAAGVAIVLYVLGGTLWLSVLCVGPASVVPYVLIRYLRSRRMYKLDRQLPEFLLALAGAVQAGSGLQQAFRHIGAQCPAPLGQELGLVLREQRMGLPFDQVLTNLAQRLSMESMHLCVSSLRIASQTGGSLGPLLQDMAATLRARQALEGKVDALTAQGKLQAWIMAALPLVLAGVLALIDPQAMVLFQDSIAGWAVICVVIVLDVIGLWMIRRIVDIKV